MSYSRLELESKFFQSKNGLYKRRVGRGFVIAWYFPGYGGKITKVTTKPL
jgi:hypothetical protein